jgi:hypothetical protein
MVEKEEDLESSINPTQPNFVKILKPPEDWSFEPYRFGKVRETFLHIGYEAKRSEQEKEF